jgi:hypothetical protein
VLLQPSPQGLQLPAQPDQAQQLQTLELAQQQRLTSQSLVVTLAQLVQQVQLGLQTYLASQVQQLVQLDLARL